MAVDWKMLSSVAGDLLAEFGVFCLRVEDVEPAETVVVLGRPVMETSEKNLRRVWWLWRGQRRMGDPRVVVWGFRNEEVGGITMGLAMEVDEGVAERWKRIRGVEVHA